MMLGGDSNWVVLFESTHANDSNKYTSGLIPRTAFTIDGGMAKITATTFGTYQVVEINPAITTAIEKSGTVAEIIAELPAPVTTVDPTPVVVTTVDTPLFSVAAGTYTSAQSVAISTTTAGATIYYTIDGSTPTMSSSLYSTPESASEALPGSSLRSELRSEYYVATLNHPFL
jgi:hypothetical protein